MQQEQPDGGTDGGGGGAGSQRRHRRLLPPAQLLACQPHRLLAAACALAEALPDEPKRLGTHKQRLLARVASGAVILQFHGALSDRVRGWLAAPPAAVALAAAALAEAAVVAIPGTMWTRAPGALRRRSRRLCATQLRGTTPSGAAHAVALMRLAGGGGGTSAAARERRLLALPRGSRRRRPANGAPAAAGGTAQSPATTAGAATEPAGFAARARQPQVQHLPVTLRRRARGRCDSSSVAVAAWCGTAGRTARGRTGDTKGRAWVLQGRGRGAGAGGGQKGRPMMPVRELAAAVTCAGRFCLVLRWLLATGLYSNMCCSTLSGAARQGCT